MENTQTHREIRLGDTLVVGRPSVPTRKSVAGQLAALGSDLQAISSTVNERRQLVTLFLEAVIARASLMGIAWIEFGQNKKGKIVDSRFRNPSVHSEPFEQELKEVADIVHANKSVQVCQAEKVHGATAIGVPVYVDQKTTAVICGISGSSGNRGRDNVLVLHLLAAHFDIWRAREELKGLGRELRNTAAVLELVGKTQCTDSVRRAGQIVANELKQQFQCDYVAVGMQNGKQQQCKPIAISSMANFDNNSTTITLFRNAFDEAVTRGEYTVFPPRTEAHRSSSLSHKKLAAQLNCESAITIPLRNQEDVLVGAVTVIGNFALDRNEATRNLMNSLEHPIGNSMHFVRLAQGGPLRRLGRLMVAKRNSTWLLSIAGILLLTLLAMFVPVHYQVHSRFTAEPMVRRFSVAPHEGLLENTFVQPGDSVNAGQLLARMDGREIRFEMAGIIADRERAIKKRDTYKSNRQNSEELMAENERIKLETQGKILEHRENNLEICSPIDGIILSGSIDRRENFPVTIGQSLYEIAPINQLRIEIAVSDDQIMHVAEGQEIKLRFEGFGTATIDATVDRIRPSSAIRDSKNVYIVEAIVDNENGELRPGMKGTARIYGDKHAWGWNLFHLPWERFVTAIGF